MKVQQIETAKGKTWLVDGYLINNSQQIRVKKRGFDSKRSAQQWFNNESVLFENGESKYNKKTTPNVMTVKELYDMWLGTYQHTVEESTLNKTMNVFNIHIIPEWGQTLVSDIKPLDLQRYINTMQGKILHYRKITGYFRRLLNIAVRMDMIDVDPFTKIDMPKERRQTNKPKQFMDVDEFKAFVAVLDNQYKYINQQAYTLLRLGAFTGMRTEELLALQWQHVDFDNGYINIVQALGRGLNGSTYIKMPKSQTSKRTLKIDNKMLEIIVQWYEQSKYHKLNDYVFSYQGNTLQVMRPNKWLHDVSNQFNVAVGLSMHKLRHTWATLALDQGASVKQVQTYLGHADVSMTLDVYSDITKRASDETGNILTKLEV
ncbi:site-specific integrase [Leuconostoc gelidum subsp. gelidum]|uniref:tyrosine-type recombinase/integrase n=1 Tax=Leuconostoc gelidum TaxID=1244 RepID=UPI001CC38598|nr:site-specific integrase [Leuconostoc gelidum]MBZ6014712.1 site-specific integrase [Leuconostoc gelidum subsp. gelidum]